MKIKVNTDIRNFKITRNRDSFIQAMRAYEGKEVELSEWAAEAVSQVELNARAAEILKDNKSYFS